MREGIKQLTISIIVLLVAVILTIIFTPFGLAYGITYRVIYKRDFTYIAKILKRVAVSLDQLDNVTNGDFLNHTLTRSGENFGLEDDTVSEVIARHNNGNLTKSGKFIATFLEKVDPGHLASSLEENVL